MSDYWLGVLTVPAILAAITVLAGAYFAAWRTLDRVGITIDVKRHRALDKISDYTLRHDIWWERSFGPIFVGGWYRERPSDGRPRLGRWIGIGHPEGPCAMVIRSQDLAGRPA